jgi:hypothetical protein
MSRYKHTTESFILKAKTIHGERYDYSLIDYNPKNKVKIICKEHGIFEQSPYRHIEGQGCPQCGNKLCRKKPNPIKETKVCLKCKNEYPRNSDYFYRNSIVKDGFQSRCKCCVNKGLVLKRKETWDIRKLQFKPKKPKLTDEEKKHNKKKVYYRWKESGGLKNYNKKRLSDSQYKVANSIRGRVWSGLSRVQKKKTSKTVDLIGCSWEYLYFYIESQFKKGMTWDNYCFDGWHIDHIRPCASFDLTDIEQQKQCFHYTNLQPLWAKENFRKNSVYNGIRHVFKHV